MITQKRSKSGGRFIYFKQAVSDFSESVTGRGAPKFYALTLLSANDSTARRAINAAMTRIATKPTGAFTNGKIKIKKQAKPIPAHSCGKKPRERPSRKRKASGTAKTTRS